MRSWRISLVERAVLATHAPCFLSFVPVAGLNERFPCQGDALVMSCTVGLGKVLVIMASEGLRVMSSSWWQLQMVGIRSMQLFRDM